MAEQTSEYAEAQAVAPPAEDAPTAAEHAQHMADYMAAGERRARALGNRGELRLGADGRLEDDIADAYWRHGCYVFENVVGTAEVEELRAAMADILARAPVSRDAEVDASGAPAFGREFKRPVYTFVRPLSDPVGGTELVGGRHPAKMVEPRPAQGAPEETLHMIFGLCQIAPEFLRLYGHPKLLAVAETINGADFTPFNDSIFVKRPGLGGSVAWHQDGLTHWDSPNWDEGIHGFNFQVQLYPTTPGNCLWVVPGTHKLGKLDIKARVLANGGSDRLPDAIPLLCSPGDVTMVNRQLLHGSFANTSKHLRISLTFGFHRRSSVLGVKGKLGANDQVYDEQRIFDRSAVVAVAIDARRQHFADEAPYRYQPFTGLEDDFRFGPETYERVVRDYNLKDLGI